MEGLKKRSSPEEVIFPFPPLYRRPLSSNTYRTLVRIFSHCPTGIPQTQKQSNLGDSESRPVSGRNGSIYHDEASLLENLVPSSKESKDTLLRGTSVGTSTEDACFQDGYFEGKQTISPKLDCLNSAIARAHEVTPGNTLSPKDMVVENRNDDCAVQVANEQENMSSSFDVDMVDLGPLEQPEVDEEFSIHDFSEVLDSCFGMDMLVESSKAGSDSQGKNISLEENTPKEAEHELQLKELELEKLIYSLGVVESSPCPTADEEIEEGEISGEACLADALFEDANPEDRQSREPVTSDLSLFTMVNSNNNCLQVKLRTPSGQKQDFHSQNVSCVGYMETERIVPVQQHLKNLTPSGRILLKNVAENQISAATEKDIGDSKKKRKRGPLTEVKRIKQKKKKRLKRAEKNRKDGVKRFKLQPVVKPKTVGLCRHYLQGKCREGEKCKFSHNAIPTTKSKPCCHFARHNCMKGDDCPFDHELSKYPCNNYTTSGFCIRGSDCLFWHEMPDKQGLPMSPSVSKPELTSEQQALPPASKATKAKSKSLLQLNNSNSSKHADNGGTVSQKIDVKICSAGYSPGKSTKLCAAKPVVRRTTGQAPKGVSFLSNGGMSLGDATDHKHNGSALQAHGIDVGREALVKISGGTNKSSNVSEAAPPRRPRGINFLSFTKPCLGDPCRQMNQNTKDLVSGNNGHINVTPLTSGSVRKEQTNFHLIKGENTPVKPRETIKAPSLSFGGLLDQSAGSQKSHLPSSSKTSFLSNTPSLVQKAIQSTLAFAAKFEPNITTGSSLHRQGS